MKNLFTLIFSLLFIVSSSLYAQNGTVVGNISDIDGPLIGATIVVAGTSTGTTTNIDGNYSLDIAPGSYTFEATYIGYQSQQSTITVNAGEKHLKFHIRTRCSSK